MPTHRISQNRDDLKKHLIGKWHPFLRFRPDPEVTQTQPDADFKIKDRRMNNNTIESDSRMNEEKRNLLVIRGSIEVQKYRRKSTNFSGLYVTASILDM